MSLDSDVAILGTGVAPLIAANRLLIEGKSVLLLNPDWDFFQEDSELPLDPLWPVTPKTLAAKRLMQSSPEEALAALRPDFPGAIELWPRPASGEGYHDADAPHVRARSRIWFQPVDRTREERRVRYWEALEAMYLDASEAGLKPQLLDGIVGMSRFPGFTSRATAAERTFGEDFKSVLVPKICDVDVSRYRNGLLEFVRERLGAGKIITAAAQVDLMPGGVRFHAGGSPRTARIREGVLVFWTPRLTQWVEAQVKKTATAAMKPRGIRLWEEWSLISRERLDPSIIGTFENMAVWAETEGAPDPQKSALGRLAVLRTGPLVPLENAASVVSKLLEEIDWASSDSFRSIARLCHDFLNWDKFSVRSMKPRAIFEWEEPGSFRLSETSVPVDVICACDGPLFEVVRSARVACERILGESG